MNPKILAVDDDETVLGAMKLAFQNTQYELEAANCAAEALNLIRRSPIGFSLVFVDHKLGPNSENGSEVARKIKAINPAIMVVMVSGEWSEDVLKSWLAAGVDQYLTKPTEVFELLSIADNASSRYTAKYGSMTRAASPARDAKLLEALRLTELVGVSDAIGQVAESALLFAKNPFNVLILGETGVGKEVVANAIHRNSPNSKKPFLAINCSGFRGNEHLLESELFGHEKGAFTGADKLKRGVFEDAQGGVVFLDEIHLLSPSAQAKLLRAIQERKVRRVGGNVEIRVDFRLIAAGKPELKQLGLDGPFTLDLYYRVKELLIEIPPLRERKEDIVPLIRHYKSVFEHQLGRKIEFMSSTLDAFEDYGWPGNVRELAGMIKELLVTIPRSVIRPEDLPQHLFTVNTVRTVKHKTLADLLAEQERQQSELIVQALSEVEYNVLRASNNLGIPRSTMRDLMKKFGINELLQKPKRIFSEEIETSAKGKRA